MHALNTSQSGLDDAIASKVGYVAGASGVELIFMKRQAV
jgi:hypothetical protein